MKKLMILVGNIGSGKSTLVEDLVKLNYFVICKDSLRYMLGGNNYIFDEKLEDVIHKTSISMLRQLMKKKVSIVIDETHMNKESRAEALEIANKHNYTTIAYILPKISKRESVKRRLSVNHGDTSKKIWEEVWDRKNAKYEEPTSEEGFDQIVNRIKK